MLEIFVPNVYDIQTFHKGLYNKHIFQQASVENSRDLREVHRVIRCIIYNKRAFVTIISKCNTVNRLKGNASYIEYS
jgi:hypothetical protein